MGRAIPATRDGAERAIVIAFVAWRLAVCAQLAVGVGHGIAVSPRPAWYLVTALAALAESVAVCVVSALRRRLVGAPWIWCEVAGCALLLVTLPAVVPSPLLVGTWVAFAPGFAHAVMSMDCTVLIAARRRPTIQVTAAIVIVTASYLVAELPHAADDLVGTVLANALTYPAAGVILAVIASYLRRIGDAADEARREAARSAEELERRRNQLLLHDSASILHLLASGPGPRELDDVLREQAASESARIRTFLSASASEHASARSGTGVPRPSASADSATLSDAVRRACRGFADLPIDAALDIGGETVLTAEAADAIDGAVRAALHNVRRYAKAEQVVVHSGLDRAGSRWDLSIRDDGCGFDASTVPEGFGLRVQVRGALAEYGISASVESEPGEGTVVVMSGQVRPANPARQGETAAASANSQGAAPVPVGVHGAHGTRDDDV